MTVDWIKQRWMEFRFGYTTYLVFLMGMSNFILIVYNFIPSLRNVIDFTLFTVLFFSIGIPAATYIGHLHIKKQLPIESKVSAHVNPYREKILEGKEVMSNKWTIWSTNHSIWNNEHTVWSLDYSIWNANLARKNMQLMNFISERFNAPPELMYNKEIEDIEKWITQSLKWRSDLEKWRKDLEMWKYRFESLQEGKDATEIMKTESADVDDGTAGPLKPIEQNKKLLK